MTENKIMDICRLFNDNLNTLAHERGIKPTDNSEVIALLSDEILTSICNKEKLELRKFIITIPHKDEETGEDRELEVGFLVTDLKELAVQFELSDLSEATTGSRIATAILTPEDLQGALKNIYTENCLDSPINKEFLESLKANYS